MTIKLCTVLETNDSTKWPIKRLLKFVLPMIELVWNVDEMLQEHVYFNIHVFVDKGTILLYAYQYTIFVLARKIASFWEGATTFATIKTSRLK
jgi:hypothetical protein